MVDLAKISWFDIDAYFNLKSRLSQNLSEVNRLLRQTGLEFLETLNESTDG